MSIFPTKILLATDGSEEADLAARSAANLASSTGSELHVLTVGPKYPFYEIADAPSVFEEVLATQKRETRTVLDEQVGKLEGFGVTVAEAYLRMGERPDEVAVDLAEKAGAGLILLGSRGLGGMRRTLLGSVSDSVVRHAHCPVLVVRGQPVSFPTKILLATDGSRDADLATTTAADLAGSTGSELHVVSVFPGSAYVHPYYETHFPEAAERLRREAQKERQEMLDERAGSIRQSGGSVTQTHIRAGQAAEEIVHLAEELDAGLVALGSRGLGGARRALMGSVSDAVVRQAHGPVLVVRGV